MAKRSGWKTEHLWLTERQQKFVNHYVVWGDPKAAAKHAGSSTVQALRTLRNPQVQKAIKEITNNMMDKLLDRKERMLQELDEIRELAKADSEYTSALRAVELQMKHLGMLTEKVEQKVTHVNEEEVDERIKKLQALIDTGASQVQ